MMGVIYTPEDSSPRTRRYFREHGDLRRAGNLFSAHAEVFPGAPWLTR